ncbi:WD repeat-containing protein 75 [Aedes albopictus]|uniref:WD repeat-containing protein 75 second beta-propeller domain-containing protein n=1 Tax=Aedes albopictus TaxID=7160 RepID=A0ABM1YQB8_AEDAL
MCIETVDQPAAVVGKSESNRKSSSSAMMDREERDENGLRIRRIAGGCMISHPPLFSPDGDTIYLVWDQTVRAFSVTTGECVRDYEGARDDIAGIVINRSNPKYLYGCTRAGHIVSWKLESGVLTDRREVLMNTRFRVNHFSILYDENDVATFLISGESIKTLALIFCPTKWKVIDTFPLKFDKPMSQILLAPGGDKLNYFAMITDDLWHWVTIKPRLQINTKKHCNNVQTRVVTCHPTEDIVAVGDAIGRVVLYKNFLRTKRPVPETYHWHANPVQCVVFSHTGNHFYSGGLERVLIKWTVGKQDTKDILPRLSDSIVQIAVAPENLKVALCTADNGIQILNALQKQTAVVQSLSRISDDFTGRDRYPVGIRVNPRTQTMILNGRIGCIQFFSTYSRSLLYTLDITLRNYNTLEQNKIIYNTVVTNVAVNAFWLATVENWSDNCHSSETRLKFWRYDESRQNYSLNTNVENVHQGGASGLEFSSSSKERDVLCASAGNDRCVKVWSLEEIEVTGGGEKLVWICVGKVDYKNLPVLAVSFSQDGSLLAAGFGNVLCAWNAETLRLKCVLSAPAGYDGSANRVVLAVPAKKKTVDKSQYLDKKTKIVQQLLEVLESKNASSLFKNVTPSEKKRFLENQTKSAPDLSDSDKKLIFKRVQLQNELTLLQKAELFHRLRIQCRTAGQMKEKIAEKLYKAKQISTKSENHLQKILDNLAQNAKFRCKRKFHQYQRRNERSPCLSQFTSIFNRELRGRTCPLVPSEPRQNSAAPNPLKATTQIRHILFCHGEYSHLVVMATENRLLVWNLLTLRVQVTVNLSVERIAIDSFTNLIAAFTGDNELYIFLPNIPMPLYHRKNLPPVFGAAWIPRRFPKSQSLNVDWQAVSQLYFLNHNQELLHLVSDSDEESLGPVVYMNDAIGNGLPNTPFAAMLAKQQSGSAVQASAVNSAGRIGVAGKNSVKEIVSSSAHTMAPISLLCKDFLRSLMIVAERKRDREASSQLATANGSRRTFTGSAKSPNDASDDESDGETDESAEVKAKISARKAVLESVEKTQLKSVRVGEKVDQDTKLRKLVEESVEIDF